jgi:DNA-binding transcriptional ArsR family regulator
MPSSFDVLIADLRALGEASRLRLLAILAGGEFSVSELTRVLGQSQPRVSRHLKLLCDAGLLEKFREQHWIYYRVPGEGRGAEFVRDVLQRLDLHDPVLASDAERVADVLEERARPQSDPVAGPERAPTGELNAVLAAELGDQGRASLFYFGASPGQVLATIATRARRVVGMNASRLEVQRARAALHSRGLNHCVLQQGELTALPQASASVDVAIIDRTLAVHPRPSEGLREVARLLGAGGYVLLVEDYDALAQVAVTANPIALVREWLAAAGLVCTRLHPVDLDGRHLLLAVATGERAAAVAA